MEIKLMLLKAILFMFVCILTSCATQSKPNPESQKLTECPEQRPSICTREYLPVCATRDTGIRCVTAPCPSSEEKTYGNACSACADVKVFGHHPGACAQETKSK